MKKENLYKGYVLTRNKMPMSKITDASTHLTYQEIQNQNPKEYAGILGEETVLIDFDDEKMSEMALKIIKDNDIKCKVLKTTRGIHCLFKIDNNFTYAHTAKQLGCGLIADIKLGCKNGIQVLKYNDIERQTIYETEEIDKPPYFFRPLRNKKDENINFIDMESGDGRNSTLYSYIIRLTKVMDKQEAKDTIKLLNEYVMKDKLSEKEIQTITRDEAFENVNNRTFFTDKGQFQFDEFAKYLREEKKIIKINGQLHIYKDGIYVSGDEWIEREMINNISILNQAKRKEVFSYLKLLIEENSEPSMYNHYIAFRNGIYDIVSKRLLPYSEEYVITNKINWDYDPDAESDIVDSILNKLSCEDQQVRAIIEEMIGYTFFRQNEMGKSFILLGPKANGKSTFQAMLQKLLGSENISSIDLRELGERFKTAELYNKLANIGDDISDVYIDDNNIFKTISTGGRLISEKKGKDPFEFEPYCKCIFSTNTIPRTRDKTGAVKRRLVIIPFDRQFTPQDPDFDPYIKYKIINGSEASTVDENMSYLIKVGLAGLERILANNEFTESQRVSEKIDEYDADNNPINYWYEELGGRKKAREIIDMSSTSDIYQKYCDFAVDSGLKAMSKIEFGKTIRNDLQLVTKVVYINGKTVRAYVKETN